MTKIVQRYVDKKLPANYEIIDTTTGEIIPVDGSVILIKSEKKINASYTDFLTINLESLNIILSKGITQVQLGLLISISSNLLINENICMQDNDEPHTAISIGKIIGNTKQAAKTKLNSLIKLGLLDYSKTKVGLRYKKVYRINHCLLKKGKNLNAELQPLFDDIKLSTIRFNF